MHDRTRRPRSWEISRHCQSSRPKERAVPCCCIEAGCCPDICSTEIQYGNMGKTSSYYAPKSWLGKSHPKDLFASAKRSVFHRLEWFFAPPCIFAKHRCFASPGAFFYYTADGKYMMKTVTPKEFVLLRQILKGSAPQIRHPPKVQWQEIDENSEWMTQAIESSNI